MAWVAGSGDGKFGWLIMSSIGGNIRVILGFYLDVLGVIWG